MRETKNFYGARLSRKKLIYSTNNIHVIDDNLQNFNIKIHTLAKKCFKRYDFELTFQPNYVLQYQTRSKLPKKYNQDFDV